MAWAFAPGLRHCPWYAIEDETWEYVTWWHEWRDLKILPWPGELLDQPYFVLETIEIAQQLLAEHERKQNEKQARENEAAARANRTKGD